jgi:polysaccharide biosynthesis protein VpsM
MLHYMVKKMKKPTSFFIIVMSFLSLWLFPTVLYSYQRNVISAKTIGDEQTIGSEKDIQQIGAFRLKKNAERLATKLQDQHVKAYIAEGRTGDNKKIYRVFVVKAEKQSENLLPSETVPETMAKTMGRRDAPESSPVQSAAEPSVDGETASPHEGVPVASLRYFPSKQEAEQYAAVSTEKGLKAVVKEETMQDEKTIYTVFSERPVEVIASQPVAAAISENSERPAGSLLIPSKRSLIGPESTQPAPAPQPSGEKKPSVSESPAVTTGEPSAASPAPEIKQATDVKQQGETKPDGGKGITAGKAFGGEGGYIHPYVGFQTFYTDNVYNTQNDKKSDFMLLVSPGIWLTVPRVNQKLLKIDSANVAPGGFIVSRANPALFRRYQTYLHYGADIELFAQNSSQNTVSHRVEGLLQYNLKGGLTLEVMDKFLVSHDVRGTGTSTNLDKFTTNLGGVVVYYDTRSKMQFRFDYTNFLVNYDAARNKFRDRHDNAFSGYSFYRISPKTALFVQYEFIDIGYESDTLSNSKEHHFWGGVDWDITAKSTGRIKAGYGIKDFARSTTDNARDFIFEAQIDYRFTPKTSIIVKALRKTNETNITTTDYMITTGGGLDYLQRITGKLFLSARLAYWNELYHEDLTFQGNTKEREDDIWEAGIALRYDIKEWLKFDLGYLYTKRDSNFSEFDYVTNALFFGLRGDFSLTP